MKKTLLALSLAALGATAFAQEAPGGTSVTGSATGSATAGVGNIGISSVFNLPGASPYTFGNINYSGRYRVEGQPVAAVAPSFSSPAVWRCATAGAGGALQFKDFALSLALPGGESSICPTEFRGAIIGGYFDRAARAEALADSDPGKAIMKDSVIAMRDVICTDEGIANSLERTANHKCDEPASTSDRKARWAAERQKRQQLAADLSRASGLPVVVAADPQPRQPKPWEAGG